ncbi:MAG: DUF4276 family protein [Moraxella sp.]|nr:DUF4276 family protein [Moraxella sp.]
MHLIFLVEDKSGETALNLLVPKLISGGNTTFEIHSYKGVGHIPKNLNNQLNNKKTTLLGKLPQLLKGFEKTFQYTNYATFVVCDLDDNNLIEFKEQLQELAGKSVAYPEKVFFCFAIEEMEAWLLGDIEAIKKAYPNSKINILNSYMNDSISGTWEILADAIYKGGSRKLKNNKDYYSVGAEKISWAKNICPYMDIDKNSSKSFNYFRKTIDIALSK